MTKPKKKRPKKPKNIYTDTIDSWRCMEESSDYPKHIRFDGCYIDKPSDIRKLSRWLLKAADWLEQ